MREVGVGLLEFLKLRGFHEENRARRGGEGVPDVIEEVYF
jgi:hypothetical protein